MSWKMTYALRENKGVGPQKQRLFPIKFFGADFTTEHGEFALKC